VLKAYKNLSDAEIKKIELKNLIHRTELYEDQAEELNKKIKTNKTEIKKLKEEVTKGS